MQMDDLVKAGEDLGDDERLMKMARHQESYSTCTIQRTRRRHIYPKPDSCMKE